MDRRAVILAGAATAVAAPVFAQTNKSPSSKGTDQPSAPQTNSSPAALSQAAKTHAERTAQIGHASLEMANLAIEKARAQR